MNREPLFLASFDGCEFIRRESDGAVGGAGGKLEFIRTEPEPRKTSCSAAEGFPRWLLVVPFVVVVEGKHERGFHS